MPQMSEMTVETSAISIVFHSHCGNAVVWIQLRFMKRMEAG